MSVQEIAELPIENIASDDSLLFMWTTGMDLFDAGIVGKAWGFEYSTIGFVWYKHNPVVACYTMSECEIVLIFKRGKIPQPEVSRTYANSYCKKGAQASSLYRYNILITEMFPTQSKIELFARPMEMTKMEGWDYWGNEA